MSNSGLFFLQSLLLVVSLSSFSSLLICPWAWSLTPLLMELRDNTIEMFSFNFLLPFYPHNSKNLTYKLFISIPYTSHLSSYIPSHLSTFWPTVLLMCLHSCLPFSKSIYSLPAVFLPHLLATFPWTHPPAENHHQGHSSRSPFYLPSRSFNPPSLFLHL